LTAKDIIVHNNGDIEDDAKKILEKYYEYLNN
jgi:dephospho-CoA kinase